MGGKRDEYVQKMKAKIDDWNLAIDHLQAKADKATVDVLDQYKSEIEKLKAKRTEFEGKMSELQASGESAWENLKTGVDHAWKAMGDSIHEAKSRFL